VLWNGELFVTGRYKDVLIVGGANHHPHDIEASAADAHEDLRLDETVAFAADIDDHERVVVGVELRRFPEAERGALASEIRKRVLADHGLHVSAVLALRPGEIPRTTSGKRQRYVARSRFERGMLGTPL
jgi:acyl-CoA synthetase (AMP-forming)/AMP-acid ligase II